LSQVTGACRKFIVYVDDEIRGRTVKNKKGVFDRAVIVLIASICMQSIGSAQTAGKAAVAQGVAGSNLPAANAAAEIPRVSETKAAEPSKNQEHSDWIQSRSTQSRRREKQQRP
jgi:hypothetical protein